MIPKFRAWLKDVKRMVDVEFLDLSHKILIGNDWEYGMTESIKFDEVALMQSTGMFDKNGVEIFEGDLVKIKWVDFVYRIKKIPSGKWELVRVSMTPNGDVVNRGIAGPLIHHLENVYIIGNIYENPELVEVNK